MEKHGEHLRWKIHFWFFMEITGEMEVLTELTMLLLLQSSIPKYKDNLYEEIFK
ncbi:hypothetical protein P7H16_23860 [Paenibacillus larvae]|nr:hypothetical protein [Paenibacillus larvae]MDT2249340.1 hypothetical protein [Paenibacillus larvae]